MTNSDAPSGEVTFLFTDVQGSTDLWERDPDAMESALAEHDRRMRAAIEANDGYVFTTAGDSFAVAFPTAPKALAAALEAQQRLNEPCAELRLRVRMALHTGTATVRDGDYFGAVVNRCARLMSAGHGGQILLSGASAARVEPTLSSDATLVDAGEHRLKDLLQPEHIFQLRHPDLDDQFPPLKTLEGPWSNLPTQITSFVGRDRELADVRDLLAGNRLLTLTGAGGAGKTRLAMQLAADSLEDFPDGARIVELAAVSDPRLVGDEVAATLDVHAEPDTPLVDAIGDRIGSRRMLLFLDNCEHLVDAVAELVAPLLRRCGEVKIVTTSRELLGVPGEATYRVPSLTMPDEVDLRAVRATDSARLFTERASLVKPDFEITADNVDAVAAICRRLDGIPLAIELAAARIKVLSPAQIADRLDERFRLLAGSSRGAVQRQRTLAAAIDWSYDHLTEPEQALFRRASVFAGDFALDAAEAICAGDGLEPFDVLDLLSAVVDKSMVVPEYAEGGGDIRYRLLETMRHYGRQRLDEQPGELGAATLRHASYFADWTEAIQRRQRDGELAEALHAFDHDDDNVRAALRFSLDAGRRDLAARIVGAIGYLWYASGAFREGIEWCRELFEDADDLPDELLAPALHAYGTLLGSWTEPEAGVEMLTREVELNRAMGKTARLAAALNNLGNLQNDLGRSDEARATLSAAIEQFRAAGEPATLAFASLAYGRKDAGDYDEAAQLYAEALAEATAADDAYGIALADSGLAECDAHRRDFVRARSRLASVRERFVELGVTPGLAYHDLQVGLIDRAEGKLGDMARHLLDALAAADSNWYQSARYWILQVVAGHCDDPSLAAELVGAAGNHYTGAAQAQPDWVTRDLATTSERVREALGDDAFEAATLSGARRDAGSLVAAAEGVLRRLVDKEAPGTDRDVPIRDTDAVRN